MLMFVLGMFFGANVGIIVAALLAMRGRSERDLEYEAWARAYQHESEAVR